MPNTTVPAPDVFDLRNPTPEHLLSIIDHVWGHQPEYLRWPNPERVNHQFMRGTVRIPYHRYTDLQIQQLEEAGVVADTRSNGPAIAAFLLAGGERPIRTTGRGWSIHHIYDGQFPAPGRVASIRAVVDGNYFTHPGGLVAIHPVADALADEVPYFAWLLREKAFETFNFDPDGVFAI